MWSPCSLAPPAAGVYNPDDPVVGVRTVLSQDPGDEPESPAEAARAAAAGAAPDEVPAPPNEASGAAAEGPPPEAAGGAAPRADLQLQLQQRAKLAEDRLGEVLTAYRQAKLDNEGFRDRVTRDVQRHWERHNQKLVLRFIEVLDNLDRALESAEQAYAGNPLIEGLILVRTQLLQILQKEGLERIPVLGLPFDPASAEAVGIHPVTDPDHDHVAVKELLRGYRLHGRLARASRVLVGVYHEPAPAPPSAEVSGETPAGSEELDPAAETIRLDDKMLREIFGGHEPETED
jgi:molecular chaperone GrpE